MTNYQIFNSLWGMALGDAWGYRQEFKSFTEIHAAQPPFPVGTAFITDDTQMSLYAMKAILNNYALVEKIDSNPKPKDIIAIRKAIADEFLIWAVDPKNNRAPGVTCLTALDKLKHSNQKTGLEGTNYGSKGCGANMRNPWFGLLPLQEQTIEELSIIQAEITHGHPLALSAAVLTALAARAVYHNHVTLTKTSLYEYVVAKTKELITLNNGRDNVRPNYLRGLYELSGFLESKRPNIERFKHAPASEDACALLEAEGWVAEEALLIAIAIADTAPTPEEALRRAVYTQGDSDSIAAITGAIIGAGQETPVFNQQWVNAVEPDYIQQINNTYHQLSSLNN